ncbi:MAG TPA: recombinase family protein [Bacteroidia bacterium]|jgi:site-specific DNA recombinase|nr:recombinase family protein [Bacteroidia bacterium]
MKKNAILYIRVSTDEQADKGYSLQHQEEQLRKYCTLQNINVIGLFKDDHSAKTFNRPEFNKFLEFLKKHKKIVDLLLFTKWDRFSRNAGDAYYMINVLENQGVEPQAIEQPLDLEIPENKIMLAFYLAAPEVENDRRAMNIIVGMRRAKKEGRWMGKIPKGYSRARDEQDKPIIVPNDEAPLLIKSFKLVAKGLYPIEEAWRVMVKQKLNVSKNQFWEIMENPVYIGKVYVPAYKDEEAHHVIGLHKPLITEDVFNEVQDFIKGRRKNLPKKYVKRAPLPLRGFLVCPQCGKNLTGSASKGNGGKYYYYHCMKGCRERVKADTVNLRFLDVLSTISANKNVIDFYYSAIHDLFKSNAQQKIKNVNRIKERMKENDEQLVKAQQLLIENKIESEDYKSMKKRYENENNKLMREQAQLSVMESEYKKYLDWDFKLIRNLPKGFEKANLEEKQKIIGSIFPERMIFAKNQFRTKKMGDVVQLITQNTNGKSKNKKDLPLTLSDKSYKVENIGVEPTTSCMPCNKRTLLIFYRF